MTKRRGLRSGAGFLVYATDGARAQAERRGLSGLLESRVEEALLAGEIQHAGDGEAFIPLGGRVLARAVLRGKTPGSGRTRLVVTRLETERERSSR